MLGVRSLLAFLVITLCGSACVAAPCVTATYEPASGGYLLQFVVHNTLAYYIDAWAVYTSDAGPAVSPEGWDVYQNWREVQWSPVDPVHDIAPGQELGGFSYIAADPPATLGWWVLANKGYYGSVTPVFVPEPAALLAVACGVGAMGVRRRRM